jgi:hypothetical protein
VGVILLAGAVATLGVAGPFKKVCLTSSQISKLVEFNPQREKVRLCYPQLKGKGREVGLANLILKNRLLLDFQRGFDIDPAVWRTLPPYYKFEYITDYSAYLIKNRIVSVAYKVYAFTGGAHGNDYYIPINWDLEEGEDIPFCRFFNPYSIVDLKRLILAIDRQRGHRIEWLEDFFNQHYIPHFQLTPEGVNFIFQKYEVAPGYRGSFTILVPYDRLERFIQPKYRSIVQ